MFSSLKNVIASRILFAHLDSLSMELTESSTLFSVHQIMLRPRKVSIALDTIVQLLSPYTCHFALGHCQFC